MQIARMERVADGSIGGVEDRILAFDRPAAGGAPFVGARVADRVDLASVLHVPPGDTKFSPRS